MIESVRLLSDPLEPGKELKAFATLKPFKGERETFEMAIPIPDDFPEGAHEAPFSDLAGSLRRRFRNDPPLLEPRDLAAFIEAIRLQTVPKRTAIYLHVPPPDRGLAVQGQECPTCRAASGPSSRQEGVAGPPIRSDLITVGQTSWVVEGSQTLRFTVVKDAGSRYR